MNKIELIGNLSREPEKVEGVSKSLVKLNIAVNDTFTREDGTRDVDFFTVMVWNAVADNCLKYLHKGSKVAVIGKLKTRTWEKEDKSKGYAVEVIAESVEFLSSVSKESKETPKEEPKKEYKQETLIPVNDDSLPF